MRTSHFVGRTDDGTRVYAEIELDHVDRQVTFTDHTEGVLKHVFAVQVFGIEKYRREASFAGQACEELSNVVQPAEGWTLDDIKSLLALWREWHLNDMNAWSDEQRAEAVAKNFDYEQLRTLRDSHGYKYGSAWLARQLPDDVVGEIKRLQQLPTGKVPATY